MKRILVSLVLVTCFVLGALWAKNTVAAAPAPPGATPDPPPGVVQVTVLSTIATEEPDTGDSSAPVRIEKRTGPARDAVVWLPGVTDPRVVGRPASVLLPAMASKGKRFEPRVLAVRTGTAVTFPNLDRIYHNVFGLSEKSRFDLGLYRNGASKEWTFDTPGVVRVYCNIHPQMAAFVVVVDSGFHVVTGRDGVALLSGVPPGRHPVRVWDEKGGEGNGSVEVLSGRTATLTLALDAAGWKEVPHKNKHGKDYPPPDDDENRY